MATYNKFNKTVQDWLYGVYAANTNQFVVALCDAAKEKAFLEFVKDTLNG
jgi:hypothetical protein